MEFGSIRAADSVQQALADRPRFAAIAAPARRLKHKPLARQPRLGWKPLETSMVTSPGMSLEFEWDPSKAEANLSKHAVSFEEAMTVFADPLARIFNDDEHSSDEQREIIIGHSAQRNLVLVSFTSIEDDSIRILSARKATRAERKEYEENVDS
jgi:uncharacterized DUF497 family protein